jgi:hypothetical protein
MGKRKVSLRLYFFRVTQSQMVLIERQVFLKRSLDWYRTRSIGRISVFSSARLSTSVPTFSYEGER